MNLAPRRIFRFHDDTPYIAWENKSCGHSPGGRLDTGGCHRTRVAATATDRVREREDGYQWLHYTILGGGIYGNTCLPARMRECACARLRAPCCIHIYAHTNGVYMCADIYTYVYIDTTEWVHIERGVLCTARGRYCRQERLSGAHNPFANERETNGRKRPRATKRADICVLVLHPVLGFTFRRVFRRLDIALLQTTAWRARSIIVRHPHLSFSLSLSLSFSRSSCLALILSFTYLSPLDAVIYVYFVSVPASLFLLPSRKPLPPAHSSLVSPFIFHSSSLFWSHSTGSTCSCVQPQ